MFLGLDLNQNNIMSRLGFRSQRDRKRKAPKFENTGRMPVWVRVIGPNGASRPATQK